MEVKIQHVECSTERRFCAFNAAVNADMTSSALNAAVNAALNTRTNAQCEPGFMGISKYKRDSVLVLYVCVHC